jgi:hypothetical protein
LGDGGKYCLGMGYHNTGGGGNFGRGLCAKPLNLTIEQGHHKI